MLTISASSNPVTGTMVALTANISGVQPTNPVYTWSVLNAPTGTTPTFSVNGDGTAGTTIVTLKNAGGHLFQLVVTDGANPSQTAVIAVQVNQTFTILSSLGSITIALPTHQSYTATAFDQFLHAMLVQPSFTWSVTPGGGTIYSSSPTTAFYLPPGVAGTATVTVSSGGKSNTGHVTINTGAYPTVATPAAASPSPATGYTTGLTVLGATTNSGGEATLTYTWTATAVPTGAAQPLFTVNGTHAAKASTAIFTMAGAYTLACTITDANGLTVTSSVNVTVNQTATTIAISPVTINMTTGTTQQFSAIEDDQFGVAMVSQPTFTWSVSAGTGSINSSTGLYTAPGSAGSATVEATDSSLHGFAAVTVTASGSPPGITFDSGSGTVTIVANDYANNIQITTFTPSGQPTLLLTSLTSSNSSGATTLSQSDQRPVSTVNLIDYHGETGISTSFRNISPVSCTARGGSGTNLLQGGEANDTLYAGSPAGSNNTLKGMGGTNNTLIGGLGTNYLYGGTTAGANNTIVTNPNAVANYVFPNS